MGLVISQDPAAGTMVAIGSSVDFVVSLGPVMITVPDVVGISQTAAQQAIGAAGLTVGTVTTEHSDTVSAGDVISQAPVAGTSVPGGSAVNLVVSLGPDPGLPPDPVEVAPELDPTVATSIFAATEFLYTGSDPIQTGMDPAEIDPRRVAVIRGKVITRQGDPLPGVMITVLNHAEYGNTLSRADGMFDLAVNGGGPLTINYKKDGFLPVQRQIKVPWQDYAWLPDVVMIPLDPQVTVIDLTSPAPMQVAMGSVVTDDDGTRQAVLMIPQGTTAQIMLPGGGTQAVDTLSLRATEYTVGDSGPEAMPAELPPTSGYTYAVELSTDEALADGIKVNGKDVIFNQPVPFYVDNFLDFPVGGIVPVGYYDNDKGAWIPHKNGLVIGIVGVTGGLADVDVDGDGSADTGTALADLGISNAEREQLAVLYIPGRSLWRVQLNHLSTYDHNWPLGPPDDAESPPVPDDDDDRVDNPCEDHGSIIECQNQTLGERILVTGTPFTLNYRSDRTAGRRDAYTVKTQISGATVPASLQRIILRVSVAGQKFEQSFSPNPDQTYNYTWDGLDAYGRIVRGSHLVFISLGYEYRAVYYDPSTYDASAFGSAGVQATSNRTRQEVTLWRKWTDRLGIMDARAQRLGGWTLSVNHAYDRSGGVLYLGDGSRRSVMPDTIETVVGSGTQGCSGDGGPATEAQLASPNSVAVGPDGSIYFSDNCNRIRRVTPDGIITTIAGTGELCRVENTYTVPCGDGGPATDAQLFDPNELAIGEDGSIFIASGLRRVRRVGPDGIITTIAGTGEECVPSNDPCGDGGPATEAKLGRGPGVGLGPDGSIYISHAYNRVRRVGPDGIITTVAGTGLAGYSGDGGPAIEARLDGPTDVAVGPDGSIYIADRSNHCIRRVGPEGVITTVAGTHSLYGGGYSGDGGLATEARLNRPSGVAVGPAGGIYIADHFNNRIRFFWLDGIITTVAGNGGFGYSGDGGPATVAQLAEPYKVAVGANGAIYIPDSIYHRIRRVAPVLSGFSTSDIRISSVGGDQLYIFDIFGRHLQTLKALTGAVLYEFNYDPDGLLMEIIDGIGNITVIERDGDGNPTAIRAPGGQTTSLGLNSDGYLESISNPAGEETTITYGGGRLLTMFQDPRGNASQFTYDAMGRLTRIDDPAGGARTWVRVEDDAGYTVTKTTALGRVTSYRIESLPNGNQRSINTYPDGTWNEAVFDDGGGSTVTFSDGTIVTMQHGPDPRFGMLSPVLESFTMETPDGLTSTLAQSRTVDLADPNDALSLQTIEYTSTVNGRTYSSQYDATNRSFTSTTPEGRQTVSYLDELGRLTSLNLGAGVDPITISRDARGRTTQTTMGAQSRVYTYDESNRMASSTNASGEATLFTYDDADRIVQVELPGGETMGTSYDENSNPTQVIMPSGALHSFGYTAHDLMASYTPPDNASFGSSYNLDKALVRRTLPSGRIVENRYETDGRWSGTSYPEATVEFTYEGSCCSQPAGITRTPVAGLPQAVSYDYDGKLVTGVAWSGVAVGDFQYTYDVNGFLTEMTLQSGSDNNQTSFAWDNDGLPTGYGPFTLTRGGPGGALSQVSDAALTLTIGFDSMTRVQSRNHVVNANSIFGFDLNRDNTGRITQKVETVSGVSHIYTFAYDANGRLVEVDKDGVLVEHYTYDLNGNRLTTLTETASYDSQDRLTGHGGESYTFNADGHLFKRGSDTFQHSARGELLSATIGGSTITYSYDGLGRMVGRTDGTGTYQYLYGNPGNTYLVTAVRDPGGILSVLYYDEQGFLFAMDRGGSMYYVATDQVGTPRVVVGASGTVMKVLEYDSFGIRINDSNPGFDLPIGFAGGLEDTTTGLVRFGYRDYEQSSGRWTTRDPALFSGGQSNLYVYVGNDPVMLRDPLGLWCLNAS